MKILATVLAPLAAAFLLHAAAAPSVAQNVRMNLEISDGTTGDLGSRRSLRDAEHAIVTRDGVAAMLLTRDVVAFQLTDRGLRDIVRQMEDDADSDSRAGVFVSFITAAVRGGVESILERSIEIPIADLKDVEYRGGELVLTDRDGEKVFRSVRVNDTRVTRAFSEADARAFVREFHRVKRTAR